MSIRLLCTATLLAAGLSACATTTTRLPSAPAAAEAVQPVLPQPSITVHFAGGPADPMTSWACTIDKKDDENIDMECVLLSTLRDLCKHVEQRTASR